MSLSPSSSSSCSSTSHTSIKTNDYNKPGQTNQPHFNQPQPVQPNNRTSPSKSQQHSEPKSFRKYNASINSSQTQNEFPLSQHNSPSSKTYFSNIPFSNYQVINNSNRAPKNKVHHSSQPSVNLGKKYHYSGQYSMVELQQPDLVESTNGNKMKATQSTEEQDQFNQELQKYFDFYKLILTNIKKPYVCEIEAQSVLVRLSPIELDSFLSNRRQVDDMNSAANNASAKEMNNSQAQQNQGDSSFVPYSTMSGSINYDEIVSKCENVNYTLELANESNVFNQVYTGDANEITLKDLKPNTKYFLR